MVENSVSGTSERLKDYTVNLGSESSTNQYNQDLNKNQEVVNLKIESIKQKNLNFSNKINSLKKKKQKEKSP